MAGKKYKAAAAMIDSTKTYPYAEAVALAKKTSCTTFDSSVEASFSLNVDPKQADQNIRGAMVLPNGTGRSQRVLVITQGPKVEEAKNAGADYVGGQDMLAPIKNGWFALVEYRVDKDGNVNVLIGKCSFSDEALAQNFKALYDQLTKVRPQTVKGIYMKGVTVSTTMGPGVKVTIE